MDDFPAIIPPDAGSSTSMTEGSDFAVNDFIGSKMPFRSLKMCLTLTSDQKLKTPRGRRAFSLVKNTTENNAWFL